MVIGLMLFMLPLTGFWPDRSKDGWTMWRDRMLLVFAGGMLLWMVINHPAFALIFALLLRRYNTPVISLAAREMPGFHGVAIWSVVLILWILFLSLSTEQIHIATTCLILAGVAQVCFVIVDFLTYTYRKMKGMKPTPIVGSLGNRTYLAAYLAMIAPLVATKETWYLLILFTVGILFSTSRASIIVFIIAVAWVWPFAGLVIILCLQVPFLMIVKKLPSFTKDSLPIRGQFWRLTWEYGKRNWVLGRGFNTYSYDSLRWSGMYGMKEAYLHAHNDYLQFYYEYGVVGIAALVLFAAPIISNMRLYDPVSGSVLALALCALYNFPSHVAPIGVTMLFLLSLLYRGIV